MTDHRIADEIILIDFLRDELSPQQRREVQERIDRDKSFKRLHDDISHTFEAMKLSADIEPPENLVEATLARIRQVRHTEALLAREEARRPAIWPTFSLRELGIIAAAVILMAVVFVPSVRQARQMSITKRCASHVGQIGSCLQTYANDNDDYLPTADARYARWLGGGDVNASSNSAALYKLIRLGYVSPVVFRCPAGGEGSFVVKAGMNDFPAQDYINYSYQHALTSRGMRLSDPVLAGVAKRMVILADSTPVFVRGTFRREKLQHACSDNHGGTGQNVLYLNMRVSWTKSPTVGVRGDNIFLAEGISEYRGDEKPSGPTDSFLLPTFSAGAQSMQER